MTDWKDEAFAARERLRGRVIRTPVLRTGALDELLGRPVLCKAEGLQHTGSFKVRGALNRVLTLSQEQRDAGLITVSAGNAALGLSFAAREAKSRVTVVMPEKAVREKVEGSLALGARVVQDGVVDATAAFARAAELQEEEGLTFVHPYDDPMVVAGASTATQELLEDHPDLDVLLVPCSGGGLLAGACVAVRALGSTTRVVGVQPSQNAGMIAALRGEASTPQPTVADGLTAPFPGKVNLEVVAEAGIELVTVTEEQILDATRLVTHALRVLVEPSSAVTLAAALAYPALLGSTVGLLLSGSNVKRDLLASLLTA